jgi:hypothetical protein
MGQTNISDLSIWLHIAVTEAKWAQIKINISEPLLGKNNPRKEAKAVKVLSESDLGNVEERGTTNLVTKISTKISNHWKTERQ